MVIYPFTYFPSRSPPREFVPGVVLVVMEVCYNDNELTL